MPGDRCGTASQLGGRDGAAHGALRAARDTGLHPLGHGPEFIANALRDWQNGLGVQTLYIEPGSPWENGYVESFNGKLRDELLDREIFYTLQEAEVLIERWRQHYNRFRPHSSLGYRPPAPEAIDIGPPGAGSFTPDLALVTCPGIFGPIET